MAKEYDSLDGLRIELHRRRQRDHSSWEKFSNFSQTDAFYATQEISWSTECNPSNGLRKNAWTSLPPALIHRLSMQSIAKLLSAVPRDLQADWPLREVYEFFTFFAGGDFNLTDIVRVRQTHSELTIWENAIVNRGLKCFEWNSCTVFQCFYDLLKSENFVTSAAA